MSNVKLAMEYAEQLERDAIAKKNSAIYAAFDEAYREYKKEPDMTFIKAAELGKKVLDDYNAAMDEQDRLKQGVTVIDVVARHEKEIQELNRLITPMMEFNSQMPTKLVGPNLVGVLNAAGFYQKKEWVGLTGDEIEDLNKDQTLWQIIRATEALLKEKNGG